MSRLGRVCGSAGASSSRNIVISRHGCPRAAPAAVTMRLMASIITFTTDFGTDSPYVAQMKGAALAIAPDVRLVDITHAVEPQSVAMGALLLSEVACRFPQGTIHVSVIDPGVGTERPILAAQIGEWRFVAPDNGLWTLLLRRFPLGQVVQLDNPEYWNAEIATTFHGRDIMAPVAAHLARGVPLSHLGRPAIVEHSLDWPEATGTAERVEGRIVAADSFGNLLTNIGEDDLATMADRKVFVSVGAHRSIPFVTTYGDAPSGSLVALIGSSGHLEIALVNGSAASTLELPAPRRRFSLVPKQHALPVTVEVCTSS